MESLPKKFTLGCVDGIVSNVSATGNIVRAKMVHASHVFSHAQWRVNFIGRVKLPFMAQPPKSTEDLLHSDS